MKIFGKKNDQKCKDIYAESYIRNIHFPQTKILQTKYTRSRWTIKFDIWKMKDVQHYMTMNRKRKKTYSRGLSY